MDEESSYETTEKLSVSQGQVRQFSEPKFESDNYVIPEKYKPISMWGYFGYELLFSIPCIGFILLCVFAFGGSTNINLRNFARSYFCFLIIAAVFIGLGLVIFGGLMANVTYN